MPTVNGRPLSMAVPAGLEDQLHLLDGRGGGAGKESLVSLFLVSILFFGVFSSVKTLCVSVFIPFHFITK